jgi:selenide,water dikinase
VLVVGGHTVIDEEVKFGMAVTGFVHPERIWRNVGAQPGDALVLTKPLGTGIVTTAIKRNAGTAAVHAAAVASMTTLNATAARTLRRFPVHACTDVTGFALLGHGYEMASGSGVRLVFEAACLPLLPGVPELVDGGYLTGGCRRNREWLVDKVEVAPGLPAAAVEAAWDPQTSGGLLVAIGAPDADALLRALADDGVGAVRVGTAEARPAGPWVRLS